MTIKFCHRMSGHLFVPEKPTTSSVIAIAKMSDKDRGGTPQNMMPCLRDKCALFVNDGRNPDSGICGDTLSAIAQNAMAGALTALANEFCGDDSDDDTPNDAKA